MWDFSTAGDRDSGEYELSGFEVSGLLECGGLLECKTLLIFSLNLNGDPAMLFV